MQPTEGAGARFPTPIGRQSLEGLLVFAVLDPALASGAVVGLGWACRCWMYAVYACGRTWTGVYWYERFVGPQAAGGTTRSALVRSPC